MNDKFFCEWTQKLRAFIWLIVFILVMGGSKQSLTLARSQARPSGQVLQHLFAVTQLDTTHFPLVDVYLSGANLGAPLDNQTQLVLKEDGLPQDVITQQIRPVGVQVAFVLHQSGKGGVDDDGLQIPKALKRLAAAGILSPQTDWLAAFSTTDAGYADVLQSWGQRQGQILNSFNRVSSGRQAEKALLLDSLSNVLDQSRQTGIPDNLFKVIILFADGTSAADTLSMENVIEKSVRHQTVIHVVQLGQPSSAEQSTLSRLAARTGGHYIVPDEPNDLDSLWNLLGLNRNQLVLSYRTRQSRPSTLSVVADVNGSQFKATHLFPVMHLKPVAIEITSVEFVANDNGQTMIQLDTTVDWPDGYQRQLKSIECVTCQANGQRLVYTKPPFDPILIPIDTLPAGATSISLGVVDELGIKAIVSPNRIPLDGLNPVGNSKKPVWIWAIIGAVVLVGGVSGFVIRQRRKSAPPVLWEQRLIEAWLINGSRKLPVRKGKNVIGRGARVDIPINDDLKVSKRHCCITADNHHFSIEDEGARNAIIINGTVLARNESKALYHENKIKIGSRSYIFQVGASSQSSSGKKLYSSTQDLINQ